MTVVKTNEILTALLSDEVGDAIEDLKTDPRNYISANYNIDVSKDISIVENTDSQMHLALPYYSSLEVPTIESLDDETFEKVAGGFETALFIMSRRQVVVNGRVHFVK